MNELLAARPIFSVSDDGDQLRLPVAYTIPAACICPELTESDADVDFRDDAVHPRPDVLLMVRGRPSSRS